MRAAHELSHTSRLIGIWRFPGLARYGGTLVGEGGLEPPTSEV
jgi:hypothetical protein